jgi:hypothetical protein
MGIALSGVNFLEVKGLGCSLAVFFLGASTGAYLSPAFSLPGDLLTAAYRKLIN